MPEIHPGVIGEKDFENINYSRSTMHYEGAIQIAKLIILNFCPDISSGKEKVLAVLFNMSNLFEEYVYRMLKKLEGRDGIKNVKYQLTKAFWRSNTTRADIIIEKNGENQVIDAKWKMPREGIPDSVDLKQMFVYGDRYEAKHNILLYPFTQSKLTPNEISAPFAEKEMFCHTRYFKLEFKKTNNNEYLDYSGTLKNIENVILDLCFIKA